MILRKYLTFVNESNLPDNLEEIKDKLTDELEQYKNFIISKISWKDNKVFYKDFDNIDVDMIMSELNKELGEEATEIFNVEQFLRKIHQILELKQKSTKRNVRDEFIEYYISLNKRTETLSGEEKSEPSNLEKHLDVWDGESSILSRDKYEQEKFDIQVELLKLQEWVKENGKKVVIVFEGRDSAGKGSTIKRFTEYMDPKGYKVIALGVPTDEEKKNWFGRYEKYLPNPGEIVFFDRSWYNRAVVEPALGYCTEQQYKDFMNGVNDWEDELIKEGVILIKFWFSITKEKQQKRFELRQKSPLKYWKFSPNDAKVVNKWDLITYYKKAMFNNTSTQKSPGVIINSNDKRVGRLNAMRYVLSDIDYEGKNDKVAEYYPEVINILR
jgi:polyphosphate kinase 2